MRVLLDTHILLWWLADDPLLPSPAATFIADTANDVIVSAATAWEIAIKRALGRLEAPDDLLDTLEANGFDQLPITLNHALSAGTLPRHHDDPFDRMLIAQAQTEHLTVVTVDRRFTTYDVDLLPPRADQLLPLSDRGEFDTPMTRGNRFLSTLRNLVGVR